MAVSIGATRAPRPFSLRADNDAERASLALADADHAFAAAIPAEDAQLAAGVRLVRTDLETGPWGGPATHADSFAMLVVGGLVMRTLTRYGRPTVELYGAGDLMACDEPEEGMATWQIVAPTSLVSLDRRFELATRRWPALWRVALERQAERSARLEAHLAALQLSRVDARIEAVLWQLAERFGKVTPDGVVLPIPLTHEVLGRLSAAKRPTVSVALAELGTRGHVTRMVDGSWLLSHR